MLSANAFNLDKSTFLLFKGNKKFLRGGKVCVFIAGRGLQLIGGTEVACGDYFLFVHADTTLPKNFDVVAKECLQVPGNVAGAFGFQLDVLIDKDL